MKFHDTIPVEPDWSKYYITFPYRVSARVDFEDTDDPYFVSADLTKYYDWANFNNIDMKHSIMRITGSGGTGVVAFMFNDESYCMAFKLRWK